MALGVARLEELGIVNHDIKPGNTIVGADGARIFDWGLACIGTTDDHLNAAAAPGSPFSSAANSETGCDKLHCAANVRSGTRGYRSATKLGFLPSPCASKDTCTAAELRGTDLFAVGATLLEALTANPGAMSPSAVIGEDSLACPIPQTKSDQLTIVGKFSGLISSYFSLDGLANVNWASADAQKAARRRIYSFLVTAARDPAKKSALGKALPMSYFFPPVADDLADSGLRAPFCYGSSPTTGPAGLATAKTPQELGALQLSLVPGPGVPPPQLPARWAPNSPPEPNLLDPPTTSRALVPLLDLLRKLLAYHPSDGFASALDAVRDIELVRILLAEAAAAPPAFKAKLDCLAATPLPVPVQAPMQAQAHEPPTTAAQREACRANAALAREQIRQRDKTLPAASAALERPNEYDVAVALHECLRENVDTPRSLLQQRAYASIVHRHHCVAKVDELPEPVEYQAPVAEPIVTTQVAAKGAAPGPPVVLALEKLPFALAQGKSGIWRKRDFGLKCDMLGLQGRGAWVHWRGGNSGAGYIVEAFDTSAGAPDRACNKRWMKTPEPTECKSLSLRFATARSADTTGTRPTTGLLKLYSGMPRLPIDALAAAINVFTREKCTMNADVVAFRRLLASAATREQPQGWKTAWAATRLSDEERSQRAAFLLQKQQINDAFFN